MGSNEVDGIGCPFGNDALWAPWRLPYIETVDDGESVAKSKGRSPGQGGMGSFLSDYWESPADDAANHVIVRNEAGMILLNKYPYTNGHLLVALGEGRPTLMDYDADQRAALWRLVDQASGLIHTAIEPQGINIGINEGRAAGAGVPSHLHVHLVPRWSGDTNFISVVGRVRVIPAALEAMYERFVRVVEQ